MHGKKFCLLLALCAVLLCACGASDNDTPSSPDKDKGASAEGLLAAMKEISPGSVYTGEINVLMPQASGTTVFSDAASGVTADVSNASEGYIMVKGSGSDTRMKARITHGSEEYTYDLRADDEYEVYPLQTGSGDYELKIFKNLEGTTYVQVYSVSFTASMPDEDRVFVYPSQYVWYTNEKNAVKLSFDLCSGLTDPADKVQKIYDYLVWYLSYDNDKAQNVKKGYIPDLDEILTLRKGICFDYAGLMAAMCRAQGIPVRLVIGYVQPDGLYHAWNQVYYNDDWHWLDATFGPDSKLTEGDYTQDRRY